MGSDYTALTGVLRAQLTAVHQQFVHVLALRHWGLTDTASRIMAVDEVDFPIAMKIIDHMVAAGQPIRLDPEPITPGSSEAEALAAELEVDHRLHLALQAAAAASPVPNLIAAALAPRQAYADWLTDRIGALESQARTPCDLANELAEIFSYNIVLIEQSMVHAFVHWHHGDRANAESAWATSGAAMMHATKIVRWLAARGAVPFADDFPPRRISGQPDEAIAFDQHLAREFEDRLTARSKWSDKALEGFCDPIRSYATKLSGWPPGRAHPARDTNPPSLRSFEKTLAKFVRA